MADSALLVLVKMLGLLEKKKTIVGQIDCKSNQSQRKAKKRKTESYADKIAR